MADVSKNLTFTGKIEGDFEGNFTPSTTPTFLDSQQRTENTLAYAAWIARRRTLHLLRRWTRLDAFRSAR